MGLFEYEKLKQHGLIPDAPEITKSRTPASKVRKSRCKVNKAIVKGGKRKGTPIKKYQETYYVPMAWIGIIEMRQTDTYVNQTDPRGVANDTTYTFKGYEDGIPTKLGDVNVSITMIVKQKYGGDYIHDASMEAMQYLKDNGMIPKDMYIDTMEGTEYMELFQMYRDNMIANMASGLVEVRVDGTFTYSVPATGKKVSWEGHEYRSVEDFIDAVTQASEEKMVAFSELYDSEMDRYNAEQAEREALNRIAPETIRIDFGEGSFEIKRYVSNRGGYSWQSPYSEGFRVSEEGISFSSSVRIKEEVDETAGGYREGVGNIRYLVFVNNEIIDNNTNINYDKWQPNAMDAEGWERNFGAETGSLDDAIATASNFVRETYDEWKAYVQSVRDYQERSRGRGLKRETVNANEWVYYDSDSPDYVDPDVVYKSKKNKDVTNMNGFEYQKLKQYGMIEKSKVKKYAGMDYMGMGFEDIAEGYEYLDNLYHDVVESGEYELSDDEPTLYHRLEDMCNDLFALIYDYADYLERREKI